MRNAFIPHGRNIGTTGRVKVRPSLFAYLLTPAMIIAGLIWAVKHDQRREIGENEMPYVADIMMMSGTLKLSDRSCGYYDNKPVFLITHAEPNRYDYVARLMDGSNIDYTAFPDDRMNPKNVADQALDTNNDGRPNMIIWRSIPHTFEHIELGYLDFEERFVPIDTLDVPVELQRRPGRDTKAYGLNVLQTLASPAQDPSIFIVSLFGRMKNMRNRRLMFYAKGDIPRKMQELSVHDNAVFFHAWTNDAGERRYAVTFAPPANRISTTYVPKEEHRQPFTLSDTTGSVIVFDGHGLPLWGRQFGMGGGKSYVMPHAGRDDALIVVHKGLNFILDGKPRSTLLVLEKETGRLLDSLQYSGEFAAFKSANVTASTYLGLVCDGKRCSLLDSAGHVAKHFQFSLTPQLSLTQPVFTLDQKDVFAINTGDFRTLLFTFDGHLLNTSSYRLDPRYDPLTDQDGNTFLFGEKNARFCRIDYRPNPFPFWWAWRYRWYALSVLLFPAVILGIFYYIRYRNAARQYTEELKQLTRRLHRVQEEERQILARDIHDDIGQSLALLNWKVSSIRSMVSDETPVDDLAAGIRETLDKVRTVSSHLCPPILDDLGLCAALEWYVRTTREQTGLTVCMNYDSNYEPASEELRTAVYRIVQEAFSNSFKHAVDLETIEIVVENDPTHWKMFISDDGKPGAKTGRPTHRQPLGIIGMNERLRPFNGTARFYKNSTGAEVQLAVPLLGNDWNTM
ncbi:hypothetical protein GF324_05570 [bacterium]|nr:hypothetical protein [bacterium]